VAAKLGYCGRDRQRKPLRGDEIQGCWEAAIAQPEASEPIRRPLMPASVDMDPDRTPVRRLEFVEVEPSLDPDPGHRLRRRKPDHATRPASPVTTTGDDGLAVATVAASRTATVPVETVRPQPGSAEPRWSLWSDGEI
jgi:hypothetical protein